MSTLTRHAIHRSLVWRLRVVLIIGIMILLAGAVHSERRIAGLVDARTQSTTRIIPGITYSRRVTERLTLAEGEPDPAVAAVAIAEANDLLWTLDPLVPIVSRGTFYDLAERVVDLHSRAGQHGLARRIESARAAADLLAEEMRNHGRADNRAFGAALELTRRHMLLVAAALLLIGVTLLGIVEVQISRRLSRLADAVRRLAAGEPGTAVDVDGDDELGRIAHELDDARETVAELARSNRELAQFAYAAAHDLKQPVFAVEQLIDWTIEDHADAMPEEARANLGRALDRLEGIGAMQADLLAYAVAGSECESPEPVDLDAVVREAHGATCGSEAYALATCIDIDIDAPPLPPIATRRIIGNLVGNAVRHHDREAGTVSVTAWRVGRLVAIEVADDGPGIPPTDHERVLRLFERDRARGGSGLGLALVNKLAERSGGSLRICSPLADGRGTAVAVTLALPPDPAS